MVQPEGVIAFMAIFDVLITVVASFRIYITWKSTSTKAGWIGHGLLACAALLCWTATGFGFTLMSLESTIPKDERDTKNHETFVEEFLAITPSILVGP